MIIRHRLIVIWPVLALLGILVGGSDAAALGLRPHWSKETLELASRLPIQDGGRIKPLSTFARFELVKFSGRSRLKIEDKTRLGSMEWLLNTLFYPDLTKDFKVILIENPAVMQMLGLPDEDPRTRFALRELEEVEPKLRQLAESFFGIPEDDRSLEQKQLLNLFESYLELQSLTQALEFAHIPLIGEREARLARYMPETNAEALQAMSYSDLVSRLPLFTQLLVLHGSALRAGETMLSENEEAMSIEDLQTLLALLDNIELVGKRSVALSIFPPGGSESERYISAGEMILEVVSTEAFPQTGLTQLALLEKLPHQLGDEKAFNHTLTRLVGSVTHAARERGDLWGFGLEIFFYKLKPFHYSLVLFILGFILVACLWLFPNSRWLARVATGFIVTPTVLLIVGITLRCIIRGRPPITNLYETTLFIPAVAIVVALVIEWINRKRIALGVAALLGMAGLFVANNYELTDGSDTMGQLIAVLNSNFWLSTHVTTINIGYAAGFLAAAIGHVYIFAKLFGLSGNREFYRMVSRMTYGVVCFGLLFSLVGTVLGGIWANYSWGRFWGWDPKENGALLIVIWNLIILHGRMGGYLRELGICMAAVFGGMVVAFSWWGVNLLGVGLHSYGFTSGVMGKLTLFWTAETLVILLGLIVYARQRFLARSHA